MSNDREFDLFAGEAMDIATRRVDNFAGDEERKSRLGYLLRCVYRAGARAQLDKSYRGNIDPVDRVRWLAERGFSDDLHALIAEVEDAREKLQAFQGTYGVTESDLHSMLGEGFHTAFRKATDHPYAVVVHKLIKDLPAEEWDSVITFVMDPIVSWLRQAEANAKQQESENTT